MLLTLRLECIRMLLLDAVVVLHRATTLSGGHRMVSEQRLTAMLKLHRDAHSGTLLPRISSNHVDLFDQTLTLATAAVPVSYAVGVRLRRSSLETPARRLPLDCRLGDHRRARHDDDVGVAFAQGRVDGSLGVLATFSVVLLILVLLLKALQILG